MVVVSDYYVKGGIFFIARKTDNSYDTACLKILLVVTGGKGVSVGKKSTVFG